MLAEAKVQAVHLLVRGLAEYAPKLAKSTHLELRPGATLQSAQDLDRKTGEYAESARHYYTVYQGSLSPREKAEALISLSQELINCGSFRQARKFLNQFTQIVPKLSLEDRRIFLAQVQGKYGWIADYEFGFQEELRRFMRVRIFLNEIPRERWGGKGEELYSTAFHFCGRARFGLAEAGVDREVNINTAKDSFIEARRLDEELDVPTVNEKVGHGYAWEARCELRRGDFTRVDELIVQAGVYFRGHQELFPNSSIMAHYNLLVGEYYLSRGRGGARAARRAFEKAMEVRTGGKGEYSKGVADALGGMAATYWKEGEIGKAVSYFIKAVRVNPQIFFKGLLGG